jgi:2,5-dihydroxypyridine 5,6-dioxygenase
MAPRADADLQQLFRELLLKSAVKPDEFLLVVTDPGFWFPAYPHAVAAAALEVGAEAAILEIQSTSGLDRRPVRAAWQAADMIIGTTSIPWIRHPVNLEALQAGARSLLVAEPVAGLRRMFPDEDVISRTYRCARRLRDAETMRIVDDSGSDLVLNLRGRSVNAQCGLADRPGRWDHCPSALVASTPAEEDSHGVLCVAAGDVLFRSFVTAPLQLRIEHGAVVAIEGGVEATALRNYLQSFNDLNAYKLSHCGWGTDERADWSAISAGKPRTWACPDQEGKLGTVTLALGHNATKRPDEFSGTNGTNLTSAHIDISCRGKSVFLDGTLIVDHESLIEAAL